MREEDIQDADKLREIQVGAKSSQRVIRVVESERLDLVLAGAIGLSRGQVKRLLEAGAVWHAGRQMKLRNKGTMLAVGDEVCVEMRYLGGKGAAMEERVTAEPGALSRILIVQGDGYVIVNKPAGMPVHPLQLDEAGTVLNAVAGAYPQVQGVGEGGLRSGVVHRLDVTTSGAMYVAIKQGVWEQARKAFTEHQTKKQYVAVVKGRPSGVGERCEWLKITQHRPAKVSVLNRDMGKQDQDARLCDLTWRVIDQVDGYAFLSVQLGTGFLHQIRVMLAHAGWPLLGDVMYGGEAEVVAQDGDKFVVDRPMLHAAELCVCEAYAEAPLPEDILLVMKRLELQYERS
ncbi:pseudouridine synthase [Poriferisphaera sp. WC338]|uniref:RluA family pseudouridine synthase n=1 Tax=Poriferisphaera sp. WC338 TaxID=3425129 RepID=UPI003D81AF9A